MKQLDDDVVSASEIAQWAWCPEAWRLDSLGFEPGNRAALEKGEKIHETTAIFEQSSRSVISAGWWLVVAAVILALAALILVRG